MFRPNSVCAATLATAPLIRAKYTTNCDAHLAESAFSDALSIYCTTFYSLAST
ncbi:MAG: DUF6783 domain-containing protein [Blautia wexlerae]